MKKQNLLLMLASVTALCVGCKNGNETTSGSGQEPTGTPTTEVGPTTNSGLTTEAPSTAAPTTPTPTTPTPTTPVVPSITLDEFESAMTTANSKSDSIASGTIKYKVVGGYSPCDSTLVYEYGKDCFHYQEDFYGDIVDYYLIKDGSEYAYVQQNSDGEYLKPYSDFSGDVIDYPFSSAFGSWDKYYGVGSFITSIFTNGKANVNKDFAYNLKDGVYSFTFGYWTAGYSGTPSQYHDTKVSFELGEAKEFSKLNINVDTYASSSFVYDDELGVVYLKDDATAGTSKSYEITQVRGDRNYTCPFKLSDFYATSFDLYYDDEKVTSETTINVVKEGEAKLSISNILPATASFDFDEFELVIDEGKEEGVSGYYDNYYGKYVITGMETGSYTVSLKTKNVTKTFKVEVTALVPTSASYYYAVSKPDGTYESIMTDSKTINGYVDCEYVLFALIEPFNADQEVSVEVISGGDGASLVTRNFAISEWADPEDHWCFSASAAGTYVVRISSKNYSSVYVDVTFNISAAPSFATVLTANSYAYVDYSGIKYVFDFAPSADDNKGTVTITDHASSKTESASYEISASDYGYKMALTHVSGESFEISELALSESYDLFIYEESEYSEVGSYAILSVVTPELYLCGGWTGDIEGFTLEMTVNQDKSVSINFYSSDYTVYQNAFGYISLTEGENGYTGIITAYETYEDSKIEFPISLTLNEDLSSMSISLVVDGTTYNFTLTVPSYDEY